MWLKLSKSLLFKGKNMKKIALILSVLACNQIAQAKTIELPADTILWRPSDLPGYQLALQKCSACHSAHYAEYQPPNTEIGYWNAQVLRMKNVFKAPVTDEEVPVIVEYLNQTYGANRK
jgi:sulfite dehydrogenase